MTQIYFNEFESSDDNVGCEIKITKYRKYYEIRFEQTMFEDDKFDLKYFVDIEPITKSYQKKIKDDHIEVSRAEYVFQRVITLTCRYSKNEAHLEPHELFIINP